MTRKLLPLLGLLAAIAAASAQAQEIKLGQTAQVDTRNGVVQGKVVRIFPEVTNGLVKIDVQDHELEVLAGMEQTLASRPAILCEVGEATAGAIAERLGDWRPYRVETRRVREGLGDVRGYFNALFVPDGIR